MSTDEQIVAEVQGAQQGFPRRTFPKMGGEEHKSYVLGFCFMHHNTEVVLIRKNKPQWQAGMLNGVGGKIEQGEEPDEAMAREWKEETGTVIEAEAWEPLVVMRFPGATIFVFSFRAPQIISVRSETDEQVGIYNVRDVLNSSGVIQNLKWLIPMALFDAPRDVAKAPNIFYL